MFTLCTANWLQLVAHAHGKGHRLYAYHAHVKGGHSLPFLFTLYVVHAASSYASFTVLSAEAVLSFCPAHVACWPSADTLPKLLRKQKVLQKQSVPPVPK